MLHFMYFLDHLYKEMKWEDAYLRCLSSYTFELINSAMCVLCVIDWQLQRLTNILDLSCDQNDKRLSSYAVITNIWQWHIN